MSLSYPAGYVLALEQELDNTKSELATLKARLEEAETLRDMDLSGHADRIIGFAEEGIAVIADRKSRALGYDDFREYIFRDIISMCRVMNMVRDAGNVEIARLWDLNQFALIGGKVYQQCSGKPPEWVLNQVDRRVVGDRRKR